MRKMHPALGRAWTAPKRDVETGVGSPARRLMLVRERRKWVVGLPQEAALLLRGRGRRVPSIRPLRQEAGSWRATQLATASLTAPTFASLPLTYLDKYRRYGARYVDPIVGAQARATTIKMVPRSTGS